MSIEDFWNDLSIIQHKSPTVHPSPFNVLHGSVDSFIQGRINMYRTPGPNYDPAHSDELERVDQEAQQSSFAEICAHKAYVDLDRDLAANKIDAEEYARRLRKIAEWGGERK